MKHILLTLLPGFLFYHISLAQNNDLLHGKQVIPNSINTPQPEATNIMDGHFQDSIRVNSSNTSPLFENNSPSLFNQQQFQYPINIPNLNILNSADQVSFPGIGRYFHIKSNLIYAPTDRLTLSLGGETWCVMTHL